MEDDNDITIPVLMARVETQAAQIASLTAERDEAYRDALAADGQAHETLARATAAEASRDALKLDCHLVKQQYEDMAKLVATAEAEVKRLREVMHRLDDKRAPGVKALPAWACGIIRAALAEGGEVEHG